MAAGQRPRRAFGEDEILRSYIHAAALRSPDVSSTKISSSVRCYACSSMSPQLRSAAAAAIASRGSAFLRLLTRKRPSPSGLAPSTPSMPASWTASGGRRKPQAIDDWLSVFDSGSLRSEEHTSELQSLMRFSYAVFCLKKNTQHM